MNEESISSLKQKKYGSWQGGIMESRQIKNKLKAHLFFITGMFLMLTSSCGSGGDSIGDSTSESGSISFNIVIQNSSDEKVMIKPPGGDICEDYHIESIDATVLDESDTVVASANWPCAAHRGTLSNVPAGSNLTLNINGIVNNAPDWQNQLADISVSANQDTNIGTIELNYFGADETEPTILSHIPESDASDVTLNSSIIVTFSEDVVPASVESAISLSGASTVEGSITYDPSTFTATFTPATILNQDTPYTIEIAAAIQDRSGHQMIESYTSNFTTGNTDDNTPPTVPTLLEATAVSDSQIDLSWEAASDNIGVTKYQIHRDGSQVKSVSKTWTTDTNLSPNTNYCYNIVATDAANNASGPSNEICETTHSAPPPETPSLISPVNGAKLDNGCDNQSDTIKWDFDWEDSTNATQYRIQVIRTGSADPFIDTVVDSSLYPYSSNEYIPNASRLGWTWKVRAGNASDLWSQWSPERSFDVEPANTDCAIGLVAYYPFNGNANDASGNELHGTVNDATPTKNRIDNPNSAYEFNGSNSDITVYYSNLLIIRSQISIIAWIYPNTQKTQYIVRKGSGIPSVPYGLALSGTGDFIFTACPNNQFTQVRHHGYSVNTWSFIAGTYDGTAMKLYVNGNLVSTKPIEGELISDISPLIIGTRLNLPADTFNGKLDDIRIYNKALTAAEITALSKSP